MQFCRKMLRRKVSFTFGVCGGRRANAIFIFFFASVGEHQSLVYQSPALPKRAETFGGFDASLPAGGKTKRRSEAAQPEAAGGGVQVPPPLLSLDKTQQEKPMIVFCYDCLHLSMIIFFSK
jgi:hypothetical protein